MIIIITCTGTFAIHRDDRVYSLILLKKRSLHVGLHVFVHVQLTLHFICQIHFDYKSSFKLVLKEKILRETNIE